MPALSPAQVRAIRRRQLAMFVGDCVTGPGSTLAALRRRGLVVGRQPFAELTPLGQRVARLIDRKEPKS